jgi:hypothetical protein
MAAKVPQPSQGDERPSPVTLAPGTIKRIHVNQHTIRRNAKTGGTEPPISVKSSRGSLPCRTVEILGASQVVYSPTKPLSCGARVWIETRAGVIVDPA